MCIGKRYKSSLPDARLQGEAKHATPHVIIFYEHAPTSFIMHYHI